MYVWAGITYCIGNEEIISQKTVMQQGWNDALQARVTPVWLQCTHTDEERFVARPVRTKSSSSKTIRITFNTIPICFPNPIFCLMGKFVFQTSDCLHDILDVIVHNRYQYLAMEMTNCISQKNAKSLLQQQQVTYHCGKRRWETENCASCYTVYPQCW